MGLLYLSLHKYAVCCIKLAQHEVRRRLMFKTTLKIKAAQKYEIHLQVKQTVTLDRETMLEHGAGFLFVLLVTENKQFLLM